jgi:hypothetical protein
MHPDRARVYRTATPATTGARPRGELPPRPARMAHGSTVELTWAPGAVRRARDAGRPTVEMTAVITCGGRRRRGEPPPRERGIADELLAAEAPAAEVVAPSPRRVAAALIAGALVAAALWLVYAALG